MKKYFLLVLILTFSIPTFSKKKKEKTKIPDEYEVFQSGDWELRLFYWNKNSAHRMVHGTLYLRNLEMPLGENNDVLETDLGRMRYILRTERNVGMSGWIPEGGLNLELYKVNKVLGYGDLIRIQAQNNPDLKDLTEEEKLQQLLQQEYEWKHGPQNKQESEETDIHEMMYE